MFGDMDEWAEVYRRVLGDGPGRRAARREYGIHCKIEGVRRRFGHGLCPDAGREPPRPAAGRPAARRGAGPLRGNAARIASGPFRGRSTVALTAYGRPVEFVRLGGLLAGRIGAAPASPGRGPAICWDDPGGRWNLFRRFDMSRPRATVVALALAVLGGWGPIALACTSIVVSRGASKDGSVMVTYSADAPFLPKLLYVPGGPRKAGEPIQVRGWEDDRPCGPIKQVAQTYSVVALMNEHQLSLAETTTGGRRELVNRGGTLDYDALMLLTLQRARTARDAIKVIDELAREYGYKSSGETFSIADPNEAWIMELIGKGPGQKGIVWVAARVPDGMITAHANMSRITTFPLDDPENWLYSPDVISFAIEKRFYATESSKPFSYRDAYHPGIGPSQQRACAGRVWSIYRRSAASRGFSDKFFRGRPGAEDYPLFIKPDAPLGVADVMALMRDHYEGTPYDMTKGLDAGPFGTPYRYRELTFRVDGMACMWERPISTQQAGFVTVAQSRAGMPDAVGGVTWFTPDDASTSCFTPLYCGIDDLPAPYVKGDYKKFEWDSAWWVWNLVSNLCYDRWSRIYPDVQAARSRREGELLKMQPVIEEAAAKLGASDPALMRRFLTNYSVSTGEAVFRNWQELAEAILVKHVDGYVKNEQGRARGVGYSPEWLRRVVVDRPERFKVDMKSGETDH